MLSIEACSAKAWERISANGNGLDVELKRLRSPTVTSTLRDNSDRYVVASRDLRRTKNRNTSRERKFRIQSQNGSQPYLFSLQSTAIQVERKAL